MNKTSFMLLFYFMALTNPLSANSKYESIGIVGDSIVTGASSNPEIKLSFNKLVKFLLSEALEPRGDIRADWNNSIYQSFDIPANEIKSPVRIFFSPEELENREIADLQLEAIGSTKVDFEEQSFGYLVGKSLGILSDKIIFVGQDGKRINHADTQFVRLNEWKSYEVTRAWTPTATDHNRMTVKTEYVGGKSELPELVLMSFVANDMCHNETLEFQTGDLYTRYYNDLIGTYKNVVNNMSAAEKGTDIFFITALDPVQVLDNPLILSARKTFEDSTLTCGEIRNLKDKGRLSFIEGMCDSILATELTDLNRIEFLRSRWLEIKQAQVDATIEAQSWGTPGFTFKTITSVSDMKFAGDEVSNDCFHPSFKGHARMARAVLEVVGEDK